MSDQDDLPNYFGGFKKGQPDAFRYYSLLHHYRIYCYLLQLGGEKKRAEELTKQVFIVLIKLNGQIRDEEHLLRVLYLLGKLSWLLHSCGRWSGANLEQELLFYTLDDTNITDDKDVVCNETLIALQAALQKLPRGKREVAELYFFRRLTLRAIAAHLRVNESIVKECVSELIQWLGDELGQMNKDINPFRALPSAVFLPA